MTKQETMVRGGKCMQCWREVFAGDRVVTRAGLTGVTHAECFAKEPQPGRGETTSEATRRSVMVEEVIIGPGGGVVSREPKVAVSGLLPSWRRGDHRLTGYKPFDASSDTRKRVRMYIKQTDTARKIAALKEWRQNTGHAGISKAAHAATIETIAKRNPTTTEELIACPGVTEMLIDIAGFEILDVLRKA